MGEQSSIIKVCKIHGDLKKEDCAIHYRKNRPSLSVRCLACRRMVNKLYEENNKKIISDRKRAYREANKEKEYIRHKEWRDKNKKHTKEYYDKNKERIMAQSRAYKARNKEKIKAERRLYLDREDIKERLRNRANKLVKELNLNYVKMIITKRSILKYNNLPQEYVEAYREFMKLNRYLKELKNGNK